MYSSYLHYHHLIQDGYFLIDSDHSKALWVLIWEKISKIAMIAIELGVLRIAFLSPIMIFFDLEKWSAMNNGFEIESIWYEKILG